MTDQRRARAEELLDAEIAKGGSGMDAHIRACLAFADAERKAERELIYEKCAFIADAERDRMARLDCSPGVESHTAVAAQLRRLAKAPIEKLGD